MPQVWIAPLLICYVKVQLRSQPFGGNNVKKLQFFNKLIHQTIRFCIILFLLNFRRIAYQEATQTFGVISARVEIRDPYSGKSVVQRPSASCTASSITYSSGDANRGVLTGTSKDIQGGAIGDEVEVSSFLIFNQHTFEGFFFFFFLL